MAVSESEKRGIRKHLRNGNVDVDEDAEDDENDEDDDHHHDDDADVDKPLILFGLLCPEKPWFTNPKLIQFKALMVQFP